MPEGSYTKDQLHLLGRALKVDSRLVESELLCFARVKQSERGAHILVRSDVLDAWSAIPKTL